MLLGSSHLQIPVTGLAESQIQFAEKPSYKGEQQLGKLLRSSEGSSSQSAVQEAPGVPELLVKSW